MLACLFQIVILVIVTLVVRGVESSGDLYVFAYSWQAEFCFNQPGYAGCYEPQPYWEYNFTL